MMKDYFDLWVLAQHTEFEGEMIRQAIQATFDRRQTRLPDQPPTGLTQPFAQDRQKQAQWRAFLNKNRLDAPSLDKIVSALADFLIPVIQAASAKTAFRAKWRAGGPWLWGD